MGRKNNRLYYNVDFEDKLKYIKESIISSADVKYIWLFGSFAYGKPDEYSDIDLYIVIKDAERSPCFVYADIMGKLRLKELFEVEMLIYTESWFDERKSFTLESKILKDGKLIYEK